MSLPNGILCLKYIASQIRRRINFDALITNEVLAKYGADAGAALLEISQALDLVPELMNDYSEAAKLYRGASLLKLTGGNWVLVFRLEQLAGNSAVAIYDPTQPKGREALNVSLDQLKSRAEGPVIVFQQLQEVDTRKYSSLFGLSSIARHHGLRCDLPQLIHDYAVGENEPTLRDLQEMASDLGLRNRLVRLQWKDLKKAEKAFPCIGFKRDGKSAVICGMRDKDGITEVVVSDPAYSAEHPGEQFAFYTEEQFNELFNGETLMLKRVYKLSDEEQPFGLLWFIPEFIKLKGVFGQIALAVLLITVVALITPLFFQIVVDKVLVNASFRTLNVLGIGILVAILFNGFMEYLRGYLLLFATNKIDISTATKTFSHLMRLPISFFERVPSGVLLKHMQQTERIRGFLSGNLFFTVLELFSLVVFLPFLLLYSPILTAVVTGFSLMMAVVIALLIKPFQRCLDELYQAEGKRQSRLVESIHGIRTVKSLALEPVERKAWDNRTASAIRASFRVGKISLIARTISHGLEMLMTVAIIWIGALLVFSGKLSIGELIAFQMLSGRVTGPLVKLVGLIHEYQQVALSVRMLGVVMNSPVESNGGGVRQPLRGAITIENVSFRYRPDAPDVIRHFNLEIRPGSTIGIVGRSGSGKSTLTKLIQGLYSAQSGLVKLDGIDVRELDKSHLRSSIGVVLQENFFFNGTVRENISLTRPNATLEEIIYVSKLAGADSFVQNLQQGYDTMLDENASNLSGGQKQRLAIARALLTNPSILIFDEATSALDPESETIIQNNLGAISRGRTVLIISHRLSMTVGADKILVMDNGERVGFGTHRELLAIDGIYRDFWHQQMERNQG